MLRKGTTTEIEEVPPSPPPVSGVQSFHLPLLSLTVWSSVRRSDRVAVRSAFERVRSSCAFSAPEQRTARRRESGRGNTAGEVGDEQRTARGGEGCAQRVQPLAKTQKGLHTKRRKKGRMQKLLVVGRHILGAGHPCMAAGRQIKRCYPLPQP